MIPSARPGQDVAMHRATGPVLSPQGEALRVEHASKAFGQVQALDDVSLTVNHGEVVALVGDNGAGKSTLVKTISGRHRAGRW